MFVFRDLYHGGMVVCMLPWALLHEAAAGAGAAFCSCVGNLRMGLSTSGNAAREKGAGDRGTREGIAGWERVRSTGEEQEAE